MKCLVAYFSITSNTEKVAKAIYKGVKQAAGNCDIANIRDMRPWNLNLYEYDLIGAGAPAGSGNDTLKDFINDMRGVAGKHAFTFFTHGLLPYHFWPDITSEMRRVELTVIGWQQWFGNATCPWHLFPYASAGHPDEIDLKEAEDFGREMVERSRRISAGETELIPPALEMPPMDSPPTHAANDIFKDDIKYHEEKCLYPKCRLCMDMCPWRAIDLSLDPPAAPGERCMPHCAFCTMVCPTGALEIDDWYESQGKDWIEVEKELTLTNIPRWEAEGYNWRLLVPKEKFYKFDTLMGMVCKGHPKWVKGKGLQFTDKRILEELGKGQKEAKESS